MRVKFWGVRGSIASPVNGATIRKKIENLLKIVTPYDIQNPSAINSFLNRLSFSSYNTYGGNTTCIEIRDKVNNLIIIDAGTGLRELGNSILGEGYLKGEGKANWLFTHTHWDHINGIPFFVPFYIKGNEFNIYSSYNDIETRLRYQHSDKHFPVSFDVLSATKHFHYFAEGEEIELNGLVKVTSKAVRHPGGSYSYKFIEDGKQLVFASDAEFNLEEMENIDKYLDFFRSTDVLIFDTQYTFEESLNKIDWGHSSASIATDIALKAGVKKLVMFHHDPSYNDEKLDAVYLRALNYKSMMDKNNELEIIMAYEGLELEI
jgi:phosphoribosyl 1,2-cyclic phosphodiesterase